MRVSKHDQIKAFLEAGTLTRQEIAAKVGCSTDYVRAVRLRIAAGGMTNADRVDLARKLRRYQNDPAFRHAMKERSGAWYRKHRALAKEKARIRYATKKSSTRIGAIQGDRAS